MTILQGQIAETAIASPGRLRRPPGALPGGAFLDRCTCCGDCAEVCPSRAISTGRSGYPKLKTGASCALCGLCADICTHGAIELTAETRIGLAAVLLAERESAVMA